MGNIDIDRYLYFLIVNINSLTIWHLNDLVVALSVGHMRSKIRIEDIPFMVGHLTSLFRFFANG